MLEVLKGIEGVVAGVISTVKSKVDVEDVLQDAAVEILKSYSEAARTKAVWAAKSARRKAWRDSRRDHDRLVNGGNPKQVFYADPLSALVAGEDVDRLNAALATLDERTLLVIKLRFYEDQSYKAIGEALGLSEMTAIRIVRSGLQAIKEAVDE